MGVGAHDSAAQLERVRCRHRHGGVDLRWTSTTAAVVEDARDGLVMPSPPRPLQDGLWITWRVPLQPPEQPAHLGNGQRDESGGRPACG